MRCLVLLCLVFGVAVAAPAFESAEFDSDDADFGGYDSSFEYVPHAFRSTNPFFRSAGRYTVKSDEDDDDDDDVAYAFAAPATSFFGRPSVGVQTYSAPVVSHHKFVSPTFRTYFDDDSDDHFDDDNVAFVRNFVPTHTGVQTYSAAGATNNFHTAVFDSDSSFESFDDDDHVAYTFGSHATPSVQTYAAPSVQTFSAPVKAYSAPVQTYSAPVQTYSAPVQTYSAPVHTFSAPVQTYSAPVRTFTSAVHTAASPSFYTVPIAKPVFYSGSYHQPSIKSFVSPAHHNVFYVSHDDDDDDDRFDFD